MQGFDNCSGRPMDATRECEDSKLSTTKGPELLRTCEPRLNLDTDFLDLRTAFKALEPRLLGSPGFDNALYVTANTGKTTHRFLFDCGANCLTSLSPAEVQKIDVIFFSHLHFDHVAGFDYFLRFNFDRAKPVHIFGPPRTAEIMHNRLQGVMWDRVGGSDGKIIPRGDSWSAPEGGSVVGLHQKECPIFALDGCQSSRINNAQRVRLINYPSVQVGKLIVDYPSFIRIFQPGRWRR